MNDARLNKLLRENPAVMAIVRKTVASLPVREADGMKDATRDQVVTALETVEQEWQETGTITYSAADKVIAALTLLRLERQGVRCE
jgi:hypothetical protein